MLCYYLGPPQSDRGAAIRTGADKLQDAILDRVAGANGCHVDDGVERGIVEFGDGAAAAAHREGGPVAMIMRMSAGGKGVQALDPMDKPGLTQGFQRAIHRLRSTQPGRRQPSKQLVGREGMTPGRAQAVQDQPLIFWKFGFHRAIQPSGKGVPDTGI